MEKIILKMKEDVKRAHKEIDLKLYRSLKNTTPMKFHYSVMKMTLITKSMWMK